MDIIAGEAVVYRSLKSIGGCTFAISPPKTEIGPLQKANAVLAASLFRFKEKTSQSDIPPFSNSIPNVSDW